MGTKLNEEWRENQAACERYIVGMQTGLLLEEFDDLIQFEIAREPNLIKWETEYKLYKFLLKELKRRISPRNMDYDLSVEELGKEKMNLDDFVKICTERKFPVFEVVLTIDFSARPDEKNRFFKKIMYEDMSEYVLPKNLIVQEDFAEQIRTGIFTILSNDGDSSYERRFQVLPGCIVIHTVENLHIHKQDI